MAKTKRKKKSKQEQISEDLKMRIIAFVGLFIIVVSAMQLGPIGHQLDYVCTYLIGNFIGIGYIMLISLCIYVIAKAHLPKMNSPRAIGLYLIIGALLTLMSSFNDDNIVAIKVINQYISQAPCNRGGFIGALLYGILSALFDRIGAMIAAGFILIIGIVLLGSKFYVDYIKNNSKKEKKKDYFSQNTGGKFVDFFSRSKEKDKVFFFY